MDANPKNELTLVRDLAAPRAAVWRACREADALKHWWGQPMDAVMPVCTVDFRIGGVLHFATHRPERPLIWFKCLYLEIVDGVRLVVEQHLSDEAGRECDSPLWPASMIELGLEDMDGGTRLTVRHTGMVSERATVDNYRQGWTETLERLVAYLA